jgi:histidyl-tRNA synthetase
LNDNNVSDIDILKFIDEYINHIDIKNIKVSLNEVNIKEKLNDILLDNNTKLSELNDVDKINDINTFKTWNKNLV